MAASLPVWLDCDPGHDDALALILAAHSPAVRLLGVSTCHGNQTLAKTTLNARRVLAMAGVRGVHVYAGAAKPLLRPPRVCAEIHGASGLDGPDVAEHACCDAVHTPPATDKAVTRMHAALCAAHAAGCAARFHASLSSPVLTRKSEAAAPRSCAQAR